MPTPEILAALSTTDDALARLDATLAGLSDGDLHLAHHDGGWTAAQLVSHVNMSVLLWTATLTRVTDDPDLAFVFREEIGHDVFGYPPPRIDLALKRGRPNRRDAGRQGFGSRPADVGQSRSAVVGSRGRHGRSPRGTRRPGRGRR